VTTGAVGRTWAATLAGCGGTTAGFAGAALCVACGVDGVCGFTTSYTWATALEEIKAKTRRIRIIVGTTVLVIKAI